MTAAATLPIADYDRLRIIDILPRLAGLTSSELAAIERYELIHKYRTTLLSRIDAMLRAQPEPHDDVVSAAVTDVVVEAQPVIDLAAARVDAPVIDLASYEAHDPRLWQTLLIPVPREDPDAESSKRRWFRRTA